MSQKLAIQYEGGIPVGGYLTLRPIPARARVISVFDGHTFLIVSPERELVSVQMFNEAALNIRRINQILNFFKEQPLERLI